MHTRSKTSADHRVIHAGKATGAKLLLLAGLLCLAGACKTSRKTAGTAAQNEIVLRLTPGTNNPRNSEADFVTLKNGRILFVYSHFEGSSGDDNAHAYLASRYSADGGKTWSTEDRLEVKQEGDMNVMSVSLLRLANGKIALFYIRKNSITDAIPLMRISSDEGSSWSEPVPVITDKKGYFVLNNNRVIQLKSGRLLLAVALHNVPGDMKFSGKGRLFSYYSDNDGATWTSGAEVADPDNVTMQEPGVTELKDGSIFMFIRTSGGVQYQAFSKDHGETWSPAEKTSLASPLSPMSVNRIPSTGDLVAVWNNNGVTQKRNPLNIAVSKDEGKTWVNVKTLEADPERGYCYTAIHFTGRSMLLSYCAGIQSKGGILSETDIRRMDVDWLYH